MKKKFCGENRKFPTRKIRVFVQMWTRALAFCTRGTWLLLDAAADGIRSEWRSERL